MLSRLLDIFGDLRVIGEKLFVPMPKATDIGSLSLLAEKNAEAYPNRVALVSDEETETWTGLNQRANRVAQTLRSQGVQTGHTVALLMENRSEFVVQVLALNKLGAISALINTNLTKQSLVHCINVVESKKIIFGEELLDSVDEIKTNLSLESPNDFFFVPDKKAINCPNWAFLFRERKTKREFSRACKFLRRYYRIYGILYLHFGNYWSSESSQRIAPKIFACRGNVRKLSPPD